MTNYSFIEYKMSGETPVKQFFLPLVEVEYAHKCETMRKPQLGGLTFSPLTLCLSVEEG